MIKVEGLTKRYARNVAVDHISFEVEKGQIVGFLGPNGAGKTTLLRMGVDLLRPDSGSVILLGDSPRPAALARMGYLPEERGLPTRARVLNFLTYLGELKGLTRPDSRTQARRLLKRMELDVRETSKIGELSKGNQQKIQLASALMGDPQILLVDEPFSGLDPVNRSLAIDLLKESVAEGKAVLISTHQLQHVEQLCQRLLLLNRGRVILEGEVGAVRRSHSDGSILVNGAGDFSSLPGVERLIRHVEGNGERPIRLFLRSGVTPDDLLRQVVERKLSLTSFSPHVPTLEEIFVHAVEQPNARRT